MAKFEVKDHLLYQDGKQVNFVKSPNTGGALIATLGVVHYDAANNDTAAINWMASPASKVSAHLHISRSGKVTQQVKFNVVAWHAGKSEWKGKSGLNAYSIGIELQNSGKQEYTEIQIQTLIDVCKSLNLTYKLTEWVGHSDISPGRKVDPGEQFPWDKFRSGMYQSGAECKDIRLVKQSLNLRSGAGTHHKIITVLPEGTEVQVLSSDNQWSVVFITNTKQTGWLNNTYLSNSINQ